VTDYTTSVGSLAYSNIVQANMHQFPNTVTKNVIVSSGTSSALVWQSTVQANHIAYTNVLDKGHCLIGVVRISCNTCSTNIVTMLIVAI